MTFHDTDTTPDPTPETKSFDYLLGALDTAILITEKLEAIFRERSK